MRRDAKALLAVSAASHDARTRAGDLDRLLGRDRERPLSADRVRLITNGALRGIRQQEPAISAWRWLLAKPVGAAFVSAAVAGLLAVFVAGPLFVPPHPADVSVVAFMLNGGDIGGSGGLF